MAQIELEFTEVLLGNNTCGGEVLASYPADKRSCKMLCIADVQKYSSSMSSLAEADGMCKAYSWTAAPVNGTSSCVLYKAGKDSTTITSVSHKSGQVGVSCWNLTAQARQFQESTAAPPSAVEVAAMEARLPKLNASVTASSAAIQTFVSPDKCFMPFNWITLEDAANNPISVHVTLSEFKELQALIPSSGSRRLSTDKVTATVYADRALYGAVPVTVAPVAAAVPTCKPAAGKPASMTMTYILATLVVLAALGGFFMGKGHGELNMSQMGQGFMRKDPAAVPLNSSTGAIVPANPNQVAPITPGGPAGPGMNMASGGNFGPSAGPAGPQPGPNPAFANQPATPIGQ